jgi:uncharacterized membrane protein
MKKLATALFVAAVVGFILWSHDPIDDTVNFIIGGSIPGTTYALGFWQTIGLIALLLLGLKRIVTSLRLQFLENTAKQINAEKIKQEFAEQHNVTFDPKMRSVIAAPTKNNAPIS